MNRPLTHLLISACLSLGAFACGERAQTPSVVSDAGADADEQDADSTPGPDAGADAAPDASPDAGGPPPEATVFEPGPYNVGYRRTEITYDATTEAGRTLKLAVWYPTNDTEGEPANYIFSFKRDTVLTDATVALDAPAPLLVFSHGNTSLAEQSYFMTEFWASHGWVVIAPYHTGNTIFEAAGGINLASAPVRPQDISASMDYIYGLPAADPLHAKISDDVVMTGHSFGGFTTLAISGTGFAVDDAVAFCEQPDAPSECELLDQPGVIDSFRAGFLDPRVDVAIPQTPGGFLFFQDGLADIEVPTLLMTARRDATLTAATEGDPIWAALTGQHVRLDLLNAGHFTFSNMCVLLPGVPQVQEDGCADDFIAPELGFELINAYALAFARYHLFDDRAYLGLFDGTDARYAAEVEVSLKQGALP